MEDDFFDYDGGIYRSDSCSESDYDLNHAMLAVGYGAEDGITSSIYLYTYTFELSSQALSSGS